MSSIRRGGVYTTVKTNGMEFFNGDATAPPVNSVLVVKERGLVVPTLDLSLHSVTADTVTAGSVTADSVAADSVTADSVAADSVTAGSVTTQLIDLSGGILTVSDVSGLLFNGTPVGSGSGVDPSNTRYFVFYNQNVRDTNPPGTNSIIRAPLTWPDGLWTDVAGQVNVQDWVCSVVGTDYNYTGKPNSPPDDIFRYVALCNPTPSGWEIIRIMPPNLNESTQHPSDYNAFMGFHIMAMRRTICDDRRFMLPAPTGFGYTVLGTDIVFTWDDVPYIYSGVEYMYIAWGAPAGRQRVIASGAEYVDISAETYTIENLAAGTQYQITAYYVDVNGGVETAGTAKKLLLTTSFDPPEFDISTTYRSIDIVWKNVPETATAAHVSWSTGTSATVNNLTIPFSISDLPSETIYNLEVYYVAGDLQGRSANQTVTTGIDYTLQLTCAATAPGEITCTWSTDRIPPILTYVTLTYGAADIPPKTKIVDAIVGSTTITGVFMDVSYSIFGEFTDEASNNGDWTSAVQEVRTLRVNPPTITAAAATTTSMDVFWDAPNDATLTSIEFTCVGTFTGEIRNVVVTTINTTSATLLSLTLGEQYTVTARFFEGARTTASSGPVTVQLGPFITFNTALGLYLTTFEGTPLVNRESVFIEQAIGTYPIRQIVENLNTGCSDANVQLAFSITDAGEVTAAASTGYMFFVTDIGRYGYSQLFFNHLGITIEPTYEGTERIHNYTEISGSPLTGDVNDPVPAAPAAPTLTADPLDVTSRSAVIVLPESSAFLIGIYVQPASGDPLSYAAIDPNSLDLNREVEIVGLLPSSTYTILITFMSLYEESDYSTSLTIITMGSQANASYDLLGDAAANRNIYINGVLQSDNSTHILDKTAQVFSLEADVWADENRLKGLETVSQIESIEFEFFANYSGGDDYYISDARFMIGIPAVAQSLGTEYAILYANANRVTKAGGKGVGTPVVPGTGPSNLPHGPWKMTDQGAIRAALGVRDSNNVSTDIIDRTRPIRFSWYVGYIGTQIWNYEVTRAIINYRLLPPPPFDAPQLTIGTKTTRSIPVTWGSKPIAATALHLELTDGVLTTPHDITGSDLDNPEGYTFNPLTDATPYTLTAEWRSDTITGIPTTLANILTEPVPTPTIEAQTPTTTSCALRITTSTPFTPGQAASVTKVIAYITPDGGAETPVSYDLPPSDGFLNIEGLIPGTKYTFQCALTDEVNTSDRSTVTPQITTQIDAPVIDTDSIVKTQTSIRLTWAPVVGASEYRAFYVNPIDGYDYSVGLDTFAEFPLLVPSTDYEFYIQSIDPFGNRYSSTSVIVTTSPISPPQNLAASDSGTSVLTVTWEQPADNLGGLMSLLYYEVTLRYVDTTVVETKVVPELTTTFTIDPGYDYDVVVRAKLNDIYGAEATCAATIDRGVVGGLTVKRYSNTDPGSINIDDPTTYGTVSSSEVYSFQSLNDNYQIDTVTSVEGYIDMGFLPNGYSFSVSMKMTGNTIVEPSLSVSDIKFMIKLDNAYMNAQITKTKRYYKVAVLAWSSRSGFAFYKLGELCYESLNNNNYEYILGGDKMYSG